ncbi:MAG: glycoside hydrolase family 3 C-terminal domain-containing protein [Anaerolineae bacterium]|nr:glycoside hydrolase family 3 C-terminal domain-containing protein [Anaerolineae bacterium]
MSKNVMLTDVKSIPDVVKAMTLEEKARFVAGALAFETQGVERLGIPAFVPADGHNGINMGQLFGNIVARVMAKKTSEAGDPRSLFRSLSSSGMASMNDLLAGKLDPATLADLPSEQATLIQALAEAIQSFLPDEGLPSCFPPGIVMGTTWNPALVGQCGAAVAKEAKAFGVDMLLGPNVNIHRDPLGGRVFESYSEDPYLASQIVIDYVRGVQSEGIAADVKHFAANNQEFQRQGVDEVIPERALREIYLPAFKAAVQEGGCWTVMSAYNKINGHDCAMNRHLLTEILREEWGFEGFVVSDWGAAYDRVEALNAGNDLEMPGPQDPQVIVEAVKSGVLPAPVLDERVTNILKVLVRLPAFKGKKRPGIDRTLSARLAKAIATEGAVLLKNKNAALPLAESEQIAVLGDNAQQPLPTGGGSAGVLAPYTVSLLEGLTARFGDQRVRFGSIPQEADVAIVSIGVHSGEGRDRASLQLDAADLALIKATVKTCKAASKKLIVVLNVCGPVEMAEWIDDVDAVLLIWLGGMELGHAAAALIAGDENPSGKLPLTFPRRYQDTPSFLNFPGEFGRVWYGEGIYVGYRYYEARDVVPQFPFGYGLSYTSFEFRNLRLSAETLDLDRDQTIEVSVDVTNTGDRPGQEVVQLYIADVETTAHKPPKELKGFEKIAVMAGETRTIKMMIDRRALQHYDPLMKVWCVEPGMFRVLIGSSSADIRLRGEFRAIGFNPYGYGPNTPVDKVFKDERAMAVLEKHLPVGAVSPQAIAMTLIYAPHRPLRDILGEILSYTLPTASEERKAEIKDQIYRALAQIEI